MNAEMYSRIGGKALPADNPHTVKVINFVDEKGRPVDFSQGATITKAAHVDPGTGSVAEVVEALINAGLMESA